MWWYILFFPLIVVGVMMFWGLLLAALGAAALVVSGDTRKPSEEVAFVEVKSESATLGQWLTWLLLVTLAVAATWGYAWLTQ